MKLLGVGDIFISKRLPEKLSKELLDLISVVDEYDVKFANLETTVHDNEGYPAAFPGGGWAMAGSHCLKDIKKLGFNILSLANNHTMDYSHAGLLATMKHLNNEGLLYSGAGSNLTEASQPVYVESNVGRVGFISVTSSFHDSDAAGYSGGIIPGRPGVNPLRHKEVYQLKPELYSQLETIAEATGMNDTFKWSMKNGYMEKKENLFLRNLTFSCGESNKKISYPLEKDMERIKNSIKESNIQSDYTVISVHSHQLSGDDETPDDFIVQFCHNCIDEGADVVFGHGSHILRGIELYKEKVIFYGLGDFVLQNETQKAMPYDFYEKYNVEKNNYDSVGISMLTRSKNESVGLSANPKAFQSIMAGIEFEDSKIKQIVLYPIELDFKKGRTKRGLPHIEKGATILENLKTLSKEKYETRIDIRDGLGFISLIE